LKIPIERRPHVTTPHLPARRLSVASLPPSEPRSSQLAGARERAGGRRGRKAAAVRGPMPGIRFAPEMIAPDSDHAAYFISEGQTMTAYLISLALVGLIAIAVWEEPS
jgi:hypothetical protein